MFDADPRWRNPLRGFAAEVATCAVITKLLVDHNTLAAR
jgi:hypothetical protein